MNNRDAGETASFPIKLGYLGHDFPFLLRSLRGYMRGATAETFSGMEAEPGEVAILNLVAINPGISQNDLAAALVIKKSAVTKSIKSLEERGLLLRRKGKADRRYNALSLSEMGESRVAEMRNRMRAQHQLLFDDFSEGEQLILFEQLQKLLNRLYRLHGLRATHADQGE